MVAACASTPKTTPQTPIVRSFYTAYAWNGTYVYSPSQPVRIIDGRVIEVLPTMEPYWIRLDSIRTTPDSLWGLSECIGYDMEDDFYNPSQGFPQSPGEVVSLRRSETPYLWSGSMGFMGDMLIDSADVAKTNYRQGIYVEAQDYFIVDNTIRIDGDEQTIACVGMMFDGDPTPDENANFDTLLEAIPEGCFRFEIWDKLPLQFYDTHTVQTRGMGNCSAVVYMPGKEPLYIPNSEKMAAELRAYLGKQP